jgi:beta-ketoacyl-acyl-carrier-protein synthase II
MRRVVITGIGAITPLANNFQDSWRSVKNGLSGIAGITHFDCPGVPWKTAGEVKNFAPGIFLRPKEALHFDSFVHYAIGAALMAAGDAGFTRHDSSLPGSAGVIIGSSRGGIRSMEREFGRLYKTGHVSPHLMPSTTISMAASAIAQKLGIRGHCLGISNACASGANAVGEAYRMIRHAEATVLFAGGSEAPLCRLCLEGYGRAGALSRKEAHLAGRPFHRERDGFVLAEGAAVLVLEELTSALERGARIYGEVAGYGNTTDAFHMTKPDPEGEALAIRSALKDAGIEEKEVDYINTHGTATLSGDISEADAIRRVFRERSSRIPASALKSMTGHMLGASGAFEAACTIMSIMEGVIPPTIKLDERDPDCSLNIVTEKKEAEINYAISNSFGFGGVNAVLVLKKHS